MTKKFSSPTAQLFRTNKSKLVPLSAFVLAACNADEEDTALSLTPLPNGGAADVPGNGSDDVWTKLAITVDSSDTDLLQGQGIDELNLVFNVDASVDVSNLSAVTTINLGLDENDTPTASAGRSDIDNIISTDVTLNIHSSQKSIELDYVRDAADLLTINFSNTESGISVGDTQSGTTAIALINGPTKLEMHHTTDQAVAVQGAVQLFDGSGSGVTEELFITTSQEGGDLSIGTGARDSAFENTSTLQHVSVHAMDGDMVLMDDTSDHFLYQIDQLQTYSVLAQDADVEIGRLGTCNTKDDMETIHLATLDNGTLLQRAIDAELSDVALVSVSSSDKNTLTTAQLASTTVSGNFNIILEQLSADHVRILEIHSGDGGHILLANQSYVVDDIVVTGSGDVTIHAGINCALPGTGFVQNKPVDTTNHTGDFTFIDGGGSDTIHGSDGDDEITFGGGGGGDTYNDGPGDDEIILTGPGPFDVELNDNCEEASDDTVTFVTSGFPPALQLTFNAGGGNDYISLPELVGSSNDVLIDFADWCSGMVCIDVFTPNALFSGTSQFNFVGMSGITSSINGGTIATTPLPNGITTSSYYFVSDSDAAIAGATISNHKDLNDAADYLSEAVGNQTSDGDAAIFLVNNGTKTSNEGDEWFYYFYHFEESDGQAGISAEEIQLFACVETSTNFLSQQVSLTSADIV